MTTWVDTTAYRQTRKDRRTMALAIALPMIVAVPFLIVQLVDLIPS